MKIIVLTSNAVRHRFVANSLIEAVDDGLIVSECRKSDDINQNQEELSPIQEHFNLRRETENKFFSGNDFFKGKTLPLEYKEANLHSTYEIIKKFNPDLMIVFGSSIIKEPLLSFLESGHFINLHLGISPYYRGSGTNFWPFVNEELEYVGSTILHIDAGIDTGDIISHVQPTIEIGDNVHSIGCKIIKESVLELCKIIDLVKKGKKLPRVSQWKVKDEKYYKSSDFTEAVLQEYKDKLENKLVENYLNSQRKRPKLIELKDVL